ncbi:MAG: type II secretion system F family protein [Candidatus Pacebacteria bacterium]|nr:type II secretion system F family protein [Candidatus Paceibacterota bacterium]MDD5752752.1 type II secretion system F family protein [Candidatus Paceibacterota bacterium]
MKYFFNAKDSKGMTQKGTIEASSRDVVLDILASQGLFPISIEEETVAKGALNKKIVLFDSVSHKDVVMFTRQLSIMIDANVSPAEALDTLASQVNKENFKEKIYNIAKDVRGGSLLSKAFSKYPEVFSSFYINMIRSGEVSGDLPRILQRVAEHLESEYSIRSKTVGAMIYPAVILVVFVLIFIVIMVFIIPGLIGVLEGSSQELPAATKIVMAISNFFVKFWYLVVLGIIAIISFFTFYIKTEEGKEMMDNLVFKIPIFGGFVKNLLLARFAENLSTLISAGIQITEALEVVSNLIGNNLYKRALLETKTKVIKGDSLSSVLSNYPHIISPLFVQMVSVGEKTGKLDTSLMNIVKFYKQEAETFINSLSSIIEPILMIILAVMVGGLVAAVILPIYQISTTIQE